MANGLDKLETFDCAVAGSYMELQPGASGVWVRKDDYAVRLYAVLAAARGESGRCPEALLKELIDEVDAYD